MRGNISPLLWRDSWCSRAKLPNRDKRSRLVLMVNLIHYFKVSYLRYGIWYMVYLCIMHIIIIIIVFRHEMPPCVLLFSHIASDLSFYFGVFPLLTWRLELDLTDFKFPVMENLTNNLNCLAENSTTFREKLLLWNHLRIQFGLLSLGSLKIFAEHSSIECHRTVDFGTFLIYKFWANLLLQQMHS